MKKISTSISSFLAGAVLLVASATFATAANPPAVSGDIGRLNAEVSQINEDARQPLGESIIARQLSADFNVSSEKIDVVVGNMMQYGDAAAVLAFAEKLPGGINDRNVDEVMKIRYAGAWSDVARKFGIDPGSVAVRLGKVQNGIKTALAESSAQGRAAGGFSRPGDVSGEPGGAATGGTGTFEGMGGQSNKEPGSAK